jgi:hypothetical protein
MLRAIVRFVTEPNRERAFRPSHRHFVDEAIVTKAFDHAPRVDGQAMRRNLDEVVDQDVVPSH